MQFPPWGFGSILGDEKMNVLEQHAIKISTSMLVIEVAILIFVIYIKILGVC